MSDDDKTEAQQRCDSIVMVLPDDMADAFEMMKLCILRHRAEGWSCSAADRTITALWTLQQLAMEQIPHREVQQ